MRNAMRAGPIVVAAVLLLSVGALATQAGGSDSHGPAVSARVVEPAATLTFSPSPAFQPFPQGLTYTQVAPCRIVDTRAAGAGGKLAANSTRNFDVSGTAGFPAQGGKAGGCGVPTAATAVAISIIAVNPGHGGYLTVWPVGQSKPLASVLNFSAGQTTNTGLTVPIKPAGAPALSVFAGTAASVDVVIDVYGYYEPQTHLIILGSGQIWYGVATHLTKEIHSTGSGVYTLIFDRDLTGCNVLASDNGDQTVRAAPGWGGTSLTVNTYRLVSGSFVHGDQSFQIFITC